MSLSTYQGVPRPHGNRDYQYENFGYGHWHANVDSPIGPMIGMATIMGMSAANAFTVSTVGIKPGMHKFYALLTDNQHAPLMKPGTEALVTLNVK